MSGCGMILALESSCDESAVALFDPVAGLAGSWVSSQIALHAEYGGVVPDLASREHLEAFAPLLRQAWARLGDRWISRIAVTTGPGLAGCLAMGLAAARALGVAFRVPVEPVNHLRAHAWSPFIGVHAECPDRFPERLRVLLPHLGLIASGGNTLLFELDEHGTAKILAETGDDAAGEALDKGAKLLGLGYPGGPAIERLAASGDPSAYSFPKPIPKREDARFSFSGLKTALRYLVESMDASERERRLPDICASYLSAVVESLDRKTRIVLEERRHASLGLSGGVANNRLLRRTWDSLGATFGLPVLTAAPEHTGDNAAMIAFSAHVDASRPASGEPAPLAIRPVWRLC